MPSLDPRYEWVHQQQIIDFRQIQRWARIFHSQTPEMTTRKAADAAGRPSDYPDTVLTQDEQDVAAINCDMVPETRDHLNLILLFAAQYQLTLPDDVKGVRDRLTQPHRTRGEAAS